MKKINKNVYKVETPFIFEMFPSDPFGSLDVFLFNYFNNVFGGVFHG